MSNNKKAYSNIQRVIFALLLLTMLLVFSSAHSATINAVQSGTASSSGNGTITVSITAVDPGKSFLMFQTRSSSNRPPGSTVRGRLNAAGTAVEFVRVTNETTTINIQWYVVEFTSGVSVQRGEANQTSNTLNVPITAVSSTSQAFVLFSKTPASGDGIWSSDDPTTGRLTSTTNAQFTVSSHNSNHRIAWQVVEFTNAADINVQTGSSTAMSGGGTGSVNITLPTAVNTANSFALVGFRSQDSGADVGERMIRAQLIDATTLRVDRGRTGDRIDEVVWQVIELNDGSTVQRGSETLNNGDAQNAIAITSVDTSRSVAFASVQAYSGQNMGMNNYNGDDITGVSSVTLGLSSTSIDMRRNFTGQQADIGWFVVEFNSAPAVTLPAAVGEWRMDEASWNGTAGEVVDSSVNGLNGVRMGSATPVPAQVCNGASLNGSTDFLEVADNALLDISDKLTVMTWIKPNSIPNSGLMSILSKDENYEFHINSSANINWWWQNSGGGTRQFNSSGVTLTPGTWYHIAIVYDNSGSQKIYIDGIERGSRTYAENLINNSDPLQFGADQGFSGREFDGLIDEVRIYNAAFSAAQVGAAMVETRPCPSLALAYYNMDETTWGSVLDNSGNGNNGAAVGTAVPASTSPVVVGDPGTCGYGEFPSNNSSAVYDAVDTGVDLDDDVGNVGTINFWYKSNERWNGNSGDRQLLDASLASSGKYFYLTLQNNSRLSFGLEDSVDGDWRPEGSNNNFAADVWVHIAVTWDLPNDTLQIYINGNLDVSQTYPTNGVMGELDTLYLGDNRSSYVVGPMTGNSANGSIDEVRIYNSVRTQTEIQTDMNATHPCGSSLGYFLINHDNLGINCQFEPNISVTAMLASGSIYTGYTGSIVLDTQSGNGTWTLNTGTPANFADATANDGLATYTFATADNGVAVFDLDYQSGTASIDIDAYDGATRDDDTEGNMVFSASGFTVTASPLAVPFLGTVNTIIPAQTAASDFQLYLAAYGTTPTDPVCGIIEAYTGAKNIKFWSSYNNPGAGTLPVNVNSVSAFINEAAANGGATQPVTFANGQAAVVVNYADVGQITLAMKDDLVTADLPAGIRGASDAFVVKPAGFVLSAIERSSDSFANLGTAIDQNGAVFMAAGDNFSVTVTAVNISGNTTPNYGQENTAESVLLTPTLVAAGAASNPGIAFTTGFASFTNGVSTGTDFRWDEVGIITLTPSVGDGDYLSVGDVTGTVSANVGRFYPDHFVTSTANGSFTNTCTTGTAFTYLGEGFGYLSSPTLIATAMSAVNSITANYVGAWARLGVGGVSLSYPVADNSQLDENTALIGFTSTVGALGRNDNLNGSLTFTLGGGSPDSFAYVRDAGQVLPFTSDVSIALTAVNDGEAIATDTPKNITPVGNLQRFGRAYAQDVYGTMSLVGDSLTMPIGSWYFNASGGWTLNADDSCSIYSYVKVDSSIFATAAPATNVTLASGVGDLTLTLTGGGNPGGSSAVASVWPSWLQYDLDGVDQPTPVGDGNLYDDNPTATATFGIFRGDDRYLYWRESP